MIDSKVKLYKERALALMQRARILLLPPSAREKYEAAIRREAFRTIAQEGRWGRPCGSGWGSTIESTAVTRDIIETVVRNFNIESMLDVACGDFSWMKVVLEHLPEHVRYIGCDIVPELIHENTKRYPGYEFRVIDFVVDDLPRCDLILCRDALQHLPVRDIKKALENLSSSGAKYLLASTHLRQFGWRNARDKRVGQCRDRNLLMKPFSLADPIAVFSEQHPSHKFLGLWSLPLTYVDGRRLGSDSVKRSQWREKNRAQYKDASSNG